MFNFLKNIFGFVERINFAELVRNGAPIIDVRTKAEFQNGHIKNSHNIPLNNLSNHYSRFKKDEPIIVCCASGMRSSSARSILKANGFTKVYNGGGWASLKRKIE